MTNEERDLISRFVARVGGAPQGGSFGSVPGSATPALPPVDPEADRFISDQFAQHPEARYRVTQMAFVQEAALVEAQNRIRRLEWELQQRQAAPQQQQPSRGILGSLFGGGQQAPQPGYGQPQGAPQYAPPPPQYPPNYQPGMFARGGGSGFLGSALTTAAGVAGGMVAGNALMGLFSHHEGGGGFGGGEGGGFLSGGGGQSDPWAGAGVADPNFVPPDAGNDGGFAGGGGDPFGGAGGADPFGGGGGGADPFGGGGDAGGADPFGGGGFDNGGGGDTWT